jgi:hypothetical protein
MPSRYRVPPSPCENCHNGPSGACRRTFWTEKIRNGCRPWTEWYRAAWRGLTAALRGEPTPPARLVAPPVEYRRKEAEDDG